MQRPLPSSHRTEAPRAGVPAAGAGVQSENVPGEDGTLTADGMSMAGWLALLALVALSWPSVLELIGIDLSPLDQGRVVRIAHCAAAVVAAVMLFRSATTMSGRRRWSWTSMAAGGALFAAGDLVWVAASLLVPERATEASWYAVLTPGLLALATGLALTPGSGDRVSSRIRRLDVLIVAFATITIVWARPSQAIVQQFGNSVRHVSSEQSTVLEQSTLFGLALVIVAMTTVARCRPERGSATRSAAAALATAGIGELLLSTDPIDSSDVSSLTGVLPLVSIALLIFAGRRLSAASVATAAPATPATPGRPGSTPQRARPFAIQVALPELATLLALSAVALRQFATDSLNVTGLALGTIVVALSIVRLARLEYEQGQLTRSLRTSAERLFHDARVDTLTGLGNRLALDEDLTEQLNRLGRTADRRGLAVFCIDVDHFKHINDALGHHVGDGLLTEVATRLRVVFGEQVYRVGGDEFIALRGHTDRAAAEAMAAAAIASVRRPVDAEGHDLAVSASIGLSHHDETDPATASTDRPAPQRADELLRQGDLALYRAKELGRNRWVSYEPMLQERADHHLAVQEALARAVDDEQMTTWLQPVADLRTGRIVGARARLRWRSPEFGVLAPDEFLHDAIEGGMLQTLDGLLLRSIAPLLPNLEHDSGLQWISTTLSRQEILHPGLVGLVRSTIGEGRERFRIEVSEDTIVDDTARQNVEALTGLGIRVTAASFGTGPSSLLRLDRYPASTIKIDPSFTQGIGRRHEDTTIVASVAGLGVDLGLELAADGIDEALQAHLLVDLGFTLGEGRLVGDAVPMTEFLDRQLGRSTVEWDERADRDELAGRAGR